MNKKQLWVGIGIGMIIGAILLQLMLLVPMASDEATAQSLGQHDPDKIYSEDEFNHKLQIRLQEELDKQPKPTLEPAATPAPPPEAVKQTVIYVAYKTTSEEVVKMLASVDLITDSDALMNELMKRKLTGKIRTGVHLFEGSPSIDEIIDNLIKPNK